MRKIIAATVLFSTVIFASPGLTQVVIDFQAQPTKHQLIKVIDNATKDKNYSTAVRVANNAIKLFPDYARAYQARALALDRLGKPDAARLDFEQAKKLYLNTIKSDKISIHDKNEATSGLEAVELYLKLLKV